MYYSLREKETTKYMCVLLIAIKKMLSSEYRRLNDIHLDPNITVNHKPKQLRGLTCCRSERHRPGSSGIYWWKGRHGGRGGSWLYLHFHRRSRHRWHPFVSTKLEGGCSRDAHHCPGLLPCTSTSTRGLGPLQALCKCFPTCYSLYNNFNW